MRTITILSKILIPRLFVADSGRARSAKSLSCRAMLIGLISLLSVEAMASDWRYTFRPGDNIWAICAEYTFYDNCWRELAAHNNIAEPSKIPTGYVIKIPSPWLKQARVAAEVIYVAGAASYASPDKLPEELTVGQSLKVGQRIIVNEGSATLRFADGATIVMSANSELLIDSVSAFKQSRSQSVQVSLPRGEVKVTVPKRTPKAQFRVKTPAAVAAVRGTQFRVNSASPATDGQAGQMRSEVLEGVVDVESAGDSRGVEAGFGLKAAVGEPLSDPTQLLDAPTWNLECTDPGYVEWEGSPETAEFKLVLMEDDITADRIISTVSLSASNYTFKDLEERCYQVKINSVDGQGFNGLESQRQLCYQRILLAPFFSDLKLARGQLLVDWDQVEHADSYRVEISTNEDFSRIISSTVVSSDALSLDLDSKPKSVYVRAQSLAADGAVSEYSEPIYVEQKNSRNSLIGILAAILVFAAL